MFITFEGIDGCGKTTQIELLRDYLLKKGKNVLITKEPGGSDFGVGIERIFKDLRFKISSMCELLLMYADRVYHIENVILPNLEQGVFVISDRFQDSTVAYQGYGGKIPLDIVLDMAIKSGITLKPHITFLLDLPVEVSFKRLTEGDRIEVKERDFFERVRNGYLKIANQEPERVYLIRGNRDRHEIHREIVRIVEEKMKDEV